jgi:hypothetical protein
MIPTNLFSVLTCDAENFQNQVLFHGMSTFGRNGVCGQWYAARRQKMSDSADIWLLACRSEDN